MDLDKSLDAILANKPKTHRHNGKLQQAKPKAKQTSGAGVSKKQPAAKTSAVKQHSAKLAKSADLVSKATQQDPTKIVVHHFPSDITPAQIKDYLIGKIGPVAKVELAYNAHGKSTGTATIVFKSKPAGLAKKAAAYLHGTNTDQRNQKLQVELVHEMPVPGLAERLPGLGSVTRQPQQKVATQVQAKKGKQVARPVAVKQTKLKKTGPGRVKRVAKTAEELDADMTDYFDKKSA